MLNMDSTPKVIISPPVCNAGRIRHRKHNLWRANSAVVFVGFQSPGTLGRRLLDGVEKVKLFGGDHVKGEDRQLPGPFVPRRP